jgi:chromosome segregation ATPase
MSNELMKLIDDYAAWSAQSFWRDEQYHTEYVEIARANKEAARKAVVDAVATLQAGRAMINSAFCNLQDANDKLKAEIERNEKSAKHFHDLFHFTATERDQLQAENERLKAEREALRDSANEVVRLRDQLQSRLDAMVKGQAVPATVEILTEVSDNSILRWSSNF